MSPSQKSLLAAMACVGVGCVATLLLGFMLHDGYPWIPDLVLGSILAIAWTVLAFGVFAVLRPRSGGVAAARVPRWVAKQPLPPAPPELSAAEIAARKQRQAEARRESEIAFAAFKEATRLRVAELAADPKRRQYAPMVERGDWWTDEQIAYYENPHAVATCAHLQPVERAMRAAGIQPRLLTEAWYRGFGPPGADPGGLRHPRVGIAAAIPTCGFGAI